jgi:hypothetical protein
MLQNNNAVANFKLKVIAQRCHDRNMHEENTREQHCFDLCAASSLCAFVATFPNKKLKTS